MPHELQYRHDRIKPRESCAAFWLRFRTGRPFRFSDLSEMATDGSAGHCGLDEHHLVWAGTSRNGMRTLLRRVRAGQGIRRSARPCNWTPSASVPFVISSVWFDFKTLFPKTPNRLIIRRAVNGVPKKFG